MARILCRRPRRSAESWHATPTDAAMVRTVPSGGGAFGGLAGAVLKEHRPIISIVSDRRDAFSAGLQASFRQRVHISEKSCGDELGSRPGA
jgi:hypothetical protein